MLTSTSTSTSLVVVVVGNVFVNTSLVILRRYYLRLPVCMHKHLLLYVHSCGTHPGYFLCVSGLVPGPGLLMMSGTQGTTFAFTVSPHASTRQARDKFTFPFPFATTFVNTFAFPSSLSHSCQFYIRSAFAFFSFSWFLLYLHAALLLVTCTFFS